LNLTEARSVAFVIFTYILRPSRYNQLMTTLNISDYTVWFYILSAFLAS